MYIIGLCKGQRDARVPLVIVHDEAINGIPEEEVLALVGFGEIVGFIRVLIVGVGFDFGGRGSEIVGPLVGAVGGVSHRLLVVDLGRAHGIVESHVGSAGVIHFEGGTRRATRVLI